MSTRCAWYYHAHLAGGTLQSPADPPQGIRKAANPLVAYSVLRMLSAGRWRFWVSNPSRLRATIRRCITTMETAALPGPIAQRAIRAPCNHGQDFRVLNHDPPTLCELWRGNPVFLPSVAFGVGGSAPASSKGEKSALPLRSHRPGAWLRPWTRRRLRQVCRQSKTDRQARFARGLVPIIAATC